MPDKDDWSFQACLERGSLPNGEPLEAKFGQGWWSEIPEQTEETFDVAQCPCCGNECYFDGQTYVCDNCGSFEEWL